jgi:site-specific recombinase
MIGLNILAPVAVVGALAAFGTGYWAGNNAGERTGAQLALNAATIAAKEVVIKEVQVEKCEAEVTKVNEATTKQAVKTVELIETDQALRKQAEQRAIRREAATQKRLDAAFSTLDELRRQIDAGAFQGCANESVGAELVGMLNAALAAEDSGSP